MCDSTNIPWLQKNFGCVAANDSFTQTTLAGGALEFTLFPDAVSGKNGTANIYAWKYAGGQPLKWSCFTSLCVMRIPPDVPNMVFDCAKTECKCGSANITCAPFKQTDANRTIIECTSNISCTLKNDVLFGANTLETTCTTGECKIPIDNAGTIAAIVVVPFVLLLATIPFIAYAVLMCQWRRIKTSRLRDSQDSAHGLSLSVSELRYFVYDSKSWLPCGKKEEVEILKSLSFTIQPAKVTAVIGVAGAGKTTLLDILAAFEKKGKTSGTLLLNGKRLPKSYRYLVGYVLAEDKMLGTLTVQEQLLYTAHLRLPSTVPLSTKLDIVNDIINDLGLSKVKDTRIGDETERGLSGGEKRRVSIATQLVTSPRILILDEPTTGLGTPFPVPFTLRVLTRRCRRLQRFGGDANTAEACEAWDNCRVFNSSAALRYPSFDR